MVEYFFEDCNSFDYNENKMSEWLNETVRFFNVNLGSVSIIFCNDDYLLKVNQDFLNHDYFTDIITFNYNEDDIISGDLFISIDRVKDNSLIEKNTFMHELLRVVIHGILHLLGFNDKSEEEKVEMRKKEDFFIEKYISDAR